MLTIFYRRFYIFLFLIWLSATAGLFVLSVWGNFDAFINDFAKIAQIETNQIGSNSNSTNGTNGNATNMDFVAEDAVIRLSDAIIHKTSVARNAVRREVVHEVRAVEKSVDDVFTEDEAATAPDPIAALVAADKTKIDQGKSRQQVGEGKLTDISFTETPDKFLAQLKTSEDVGRITFFWLDNPTRLIVDLRGKWDNETSNLYRFADSFMSRVVLGMHPDRLRLVFKFANPKAPMGQRPELVRTPDGLDVVVDKTIKSLSSD